MTLLYIEKLQKQELVSLTYYAIGKETFLNNTNIKIRKTEKIDSQSAQRCFEIFFHAGKSSLKNAALHSFKKRSRRSPYTSFSQQK